MEGFTGLNIDAAQRQIRNFNRNGYRIIEGIIIYEIEFLNNLAHSWASPNAVDFSKKTMNRFEMFNLHFADRIYHITSGAYKACKVLADVNGAACSIPDIERCNVELDCECCGDTLDGATGMATESVRIYTETFLTKLKEYAEDINSLPRAIEFYDLEGNLSETYSTGINEVSEELDSMISEISTEIKNYMDNESDNILLAKEQATDMLNG